VSALVAVCDVAPVQVGALLECPGTWSLVEVPDFVEFTTLADEGSTFTLADLDSATLAEAWAAGFVLMGLAWAAGIGAAVLLRFIKQG